ncbi:MAG: hypothetical protein HY548_03095, partial [Elusimicrobia bacterium]|nr:hypothetical protein [Elusimicrobiota bacterium]
AVVPESLVERADVIGVGHTHPSGDITPTLEDVLSQARMGKIHFVTIPEDKSLRMYYRVRSGDQVEMWTFEGETAETRRLRSHSVVPVRDFVVRAFRNGATITVDGRSVPVSALVLKVALNLKSIDDLFTGEARGERVEDVLIQLDRAARESAGPAAAGQIQPIAKGVMKAYLLHVQPDAARMQPLLEIVSEQLVRRFLEEIGIDPLDIPGDMEREAVRLRGEFLKKPANWTEVVAGESGLKNGWPLRMEPPHARQAALQASVHSLWANYYQKAMEKLNSRSLKEKPEIVVHLHATHEEYVRAAHPDEEDPDNVTDVSMTEVYDYSSNGKKKRAYRIHISPSRMTPDSFDRLSPASPEGEELAHLMHELAHVAKYVMQGDKVAAHPEYTELLVNEIMRYALRDTALSGMSDFVMLEILGHLSREDLPEKEKRSIFWLGQRLVGGLVEQALEEELPSLQAEILNRIVQLDNAPDMARYLKGLLSFLREPYVLPVNELKKPAAIVIDEDTLFPVKEGAPRKGDILAFRDMLEQDPNAVLIVLTRKARSQDMTQRLTGLFAEISEKDVAELMKRTIVLSAKEEMIMENDGTGRYSLLRIFGNILPGKLNSGRILDSFSVRIITRYYNNWAGLDRWRQIVMIIVPIDQPLMRGLETALKNLEDREQIINLNA